MIDPMDPVVLARTTPRMADAALRNLAERVLAQWEADRRTYLAHMALVAVRLTDAAGGGPAQEGSSRPRGRGGASTTGGR